VLYQLSYAGDPDERYLMKPRFGQALDFSKLLFYQQEILN